LDCDVGGLVTEELSQEKISELTQQFTTQLGKISSLDDIELLRRDWLGREGILKTLFGKLRDVPADRKPEVASELNKLKSFAEERLANRATELKSAALNSALHAEYIDLSIPPATTGVGKIHPVTLIEERISAILQPFGFQNVMGPEIETDYYCFDALNIPKHHPARDMQDTFYTDTGHVLRTHTTSVQARVLEARALFEGGKLPIKVASFGRVYRNENEDASHQAMFHQYELVWIEEGLTLANLQGIITHILKELYGKRRKIRFVPKFYPYTEPSIGPQIDCTVCRAEGCAACGNAGWVTVGGAGMVHRKVLQEFKFDPDVVSGFAFGLGTSRLAAQMYNFPHLRAVYDNDLRVLQELA